MSTGIFEVLKLSNCLLEPDFDIMFRNIVLRNSLWAEALLPSQLFLLFVLF